MRYVLPLLISAVATIPAAVYEAPSPEPTADEVIILDLMNRFRADPVGEADRLSENGGKPAVLNWCKDLDWPMFLSEMRQLSPAPPLVFDLEALKAARRHSYYMVHNGLGHDEVPGKEGFVAKKFSERMKAAGFSGGPRGENCFAAARSAYHSHLSFIVDFGPGGAGGMQKGRGHRKNMISPGANVVGPGVVANSDKLSVTHNFGQCKGRFAGGIVYVDGNGNGQYDAGEGRGGATIAVGSTTVRTWASGAFTIALPAKACQVLASAGELRQRHDVPAGKANAYFTWAIPQQADLDLADKLLAKAAAASAAKKRAALVDLLQGTRGLALDPERRDAISQQTAAIVLELDASCTAVFTTIEARDGKAAKKAISAGRKAWRGTAAEAWFKEADAVLKAAGAVDGLHQLADKQPGKIADRAVQKNVTKLLASLDDLHQATTAEDLRELVANLQKRTRQHLRK